MLCIFNSFNLQSIPFSKRIWLAPMAMERGVQISVKIPSQVERLSKLLLDKLLEPICPWWVNVLLVGIIAKKNHPRHTAGLQKESHFPLKLLKSILSKSLALKYYWGYFSGAAAFILSRFCQILAMNRTVKWEKPKVCSYSEALINRRDRELLLSQNQTWTSPPTCTQVRI